MQMIGTMKKGKTVSKTYEEVIQRRDGDVGARKPVDILVDSD